MNRNVLITIIIVLVIVVAGVSYALYRERHKSGIDVEVGKSGISVETH